MSKDSELVQSVEYAVFLLKNRVWNHKGPQKEEQKKRVRVESLKAGKRNKKQIFL